MEKILFLLFTATLSYITMFAIARLLGKRQIAQLDFADYVTGISVGSIAAEMAMDISDKPFYYYIIAICVFFVLDILVNLLERQAPVLKYLLAGKPITVIYEGKLDYAALKRSKLSVNALLALAREQGYFDISDIYHAVFENSGKLSIMPVKEKRPTEAADVGSVKEQEGFPYYVVTDGRISYSTLTELNRDVDWLYEKLGKTKLSEIILAVYDEQADKITVNTKSGE